MRSVPRCTRALPLVMNGGSPRRIFSASGINWLPVDTTLVAVDSEPFSPTALIAHNPDGVQVMRAPAPTAHQDRMLSYARSVVSADARTVLSEALALPAGERAGIAAELIASLDEPHADDPTAVHSLWVEEIERRDRRAAAGVADGEDWPSLRQRLADDLAGG